ncbi:MAG: 2-nitropropane dioxygenase [Spirosoma sp.]|nr:2-nitropropane dioxygenase [Spirosoma sp.]
MNKPDHLVQMLGIEYPIIQGPMLGVTSPDMVAAIANAGGLGSLPVGGLSPHKTASLIRETKSKTAQPFAVNLFAHELTEVDSDSFEKMQDFLERIQAQHRIPFERKKITDLKFYHHTDQIDVLLAEHIPVVSFTFGVIQPAAIEQLKRNGSVLIGTATSVKEARLLEEAGIDMIVAQGYEAGGHRGTFLDDEGLPQVGLMSLLLLVVDAVSIPVLAAGGIADERAVRAAFVLGAWGVQIGSLFIACHESLASEGYKEAVLASQETSTALTQAFSGRWARGIKNSFMRQIEESGLKIPYYTFQNSLTAPLRAYGQQNNVTDLVSMWAGQSASYAQRGSATEIFKKLVEKLQHHGQLDF